jgi:uncharacterized membrane protein YdjX (TVP38/TMEM64 family)
LLFSLLADHAKNEYDCFISKEEFCMTMYDKVPQQQASQTPGKRPGRFRSLYKYLFIIAAFVALYVIGRNYFSMEWLHFQSIKLKLYAKFYYWNTVLYYMGICALLVAFAIPIVIPLTLVGGYLFGWLWGAIYITLATVVGSLMTFLVIRYLLRSSLTRRFGPRIERFNHHFKRYGVNWILMLHYSAVVPFFIINTFASLSPMPLLTFLWVTAVGALPVSLIYTFTGQELGRIESVGDVFSVPVITALVLLVLAAFVPILIRKFKGPQETV